MRVPQLRRSARGAGRLFLRKVPEPQYGIGILRRRREERPAQSRAAGTAAQPGARVGSAAAGPRPLRPPPPALTEVVHGWSSDAGPRLDVALAARLGAAPRRPATFPLPASARNGTRCRAASSATAATTAAAAARARGRLATPPCARWPRPPPTPSTPNPAVEGGDSER